MTNFFDRLFTRYPNKTRRFLELSLGFATWIVILSPVWGSLLIPAFLAYFILFFDVYWFYKSYSLVINAYRASQRIKQAEKTDWLAKARQHHNFKKMHHVLVIPNYKERVDKLRTTLQAIANQTFPTKHLHIVLAMEEREEDGGEKANELIKEADCLSLNLAQTPETEKFLNQKRLALLKPGAVIVNTAPMELVDIDALEKRLAQGDIIFILDHSDEMGKEDLTKLKKHENCIIYPPIAYVSEEARITKQEMFLGNMESFLKGSPVNVV